MHLLEELDLENILMIEDYLENRLTPEEERLFRRQLKRDKNLREDYVLVKSILKKERREEQLEVGFESNQRLKKKLSVANKLLKSLLLFSALAGFLLLVSILFALFVEL